MEDPNTDAVLLQLVICVVFFIVLLAVLGSRMPAAWDFNVTGEWMKYHSWVLGAAHT